MYQFNFVPEYIGSNVVLWFVVVVHKPFHGNPDSLCTFPKDLSVIKMSFHIDTYLLCWIP